MRNQTYSNSSFTSPNNLERTIRELFSNYNVVIHNEGVNEVNIFCPFHKNIHSPAFYINIKTGLWQCFNPSCGKKGNFRQLYKAITGRPYTKDIKLDPVALSNELERNLSYENRDSNELDISDVEIDYDNQEELDKLITLKERGLEYDTLEHFEVGYSDNKERVVIPVRDVQYKLVGYIGRATLDTQEPRYLYNKGFKRADVLFNLQNAKKYNDCIVVEGSIDAMFIHQAGYPNVVATLGSRVSDNQYKMLKRYFDSITIFSDNDDAGKQMCHDIIEACRGKEIFTVEIPSHKKDAGEMTIQEIQSTITNKKSQL
nr:MAG TPA: DNA directed DNA polymerase [Caudoviricetes sp.]